MSDYTTAVREYLAYCRWAGAWLEARRSSLDARYHPSADGAAKLIHGDAKAIRQAYRDVTGTTETEPRGGQR